MQPSIIAYGYRAWLHETDNVEAKNDQMSDSLSRKYAFGLQ